MDIAVVGPSWGEGLGALFARSAHAVLFTGRFPDRARDAAERVGHGARAAKTTEAVEESELIVMAVPFDRYQHLADDAGSALHGKVVIDTSTAIDLRNSDPGIVPVPDGLTGAQYQQRLLAPAVLVKAFNYIYANDLEELATRAGNDQVAVPIAGDDQRAKGIVAALILNVGFVPVDIGGLADAHIIEPASPSEWLAPLPEAETRRHLDERRSR